MTQITKFAFTYLLLLITVVAVAQNAPDRTGERMLQLLNEKLELSESQQVKIKGFVLEQRSRLNAMRGNEDIEHVEKLKALKEIRSDFQTKMKTVLDEGQFERYEIIRNELAERRSGDVKRGTKGERPVSTAMETKRAEMKERRKVMEPKLRAMRAEFDKEIKRRDRKKLAKLRAAFEAEKEERKAMRDKMKETGERPDKVEIKKRMSATQEKMSEEKETLDKIVAKYSAAIATVFAANPELKEFMIESNKRNGRFKMGKNMGEHKKAQKKDKLAGRFLLLDPNEK